MAAEEDFERQLEMEKGDAEKQQNAYTHTDPTDGTVYEWDTQKKAWFPKVDDDFLAAYQANYGVNVSTEETDDSSKDDEGGAGKSAPSSNADQDSTSQKGQKRKGDDGWFQIDDNKNTNVYVSGLPDDFTINEFSELMSKCGIIMAEEETGTPKLKLYKDNEGNIKGDGLCTYLKKESVKLAVQILDDYDIRGKRIHVQQAEFSIKGQYDPKLKKKKKKKVNKKTKNTQERLLNWRPEKNFHQRKRNEQVVVIKHMFDPKEFEEDAMLINDIRDDLRAECSKFGEVGKVLIFDNHPEGVTTVKFKDVDDADKCVAALNGRWFAKRQLTAELWDGTTDYKVEETEQERDARLSQWQKFLENDEKDDEKKEDEGQASTLQDEEKLGEGGKQTDVETKDGSNKEEVKT